MRLSVLAVLASVLLCGCASAGFSPSGGQRFPPHDGPVVVLDRLPPADAYTLVGVVTVQGVALTSDERMFDRLEELAAANGADAVVPQAGIRTRATGDGGEERTLAAYAIRRR